MNNAPEGDWIRAASLECQQRQNIKEMINQANPRTQLQLAEKQAPEGLPSYDFAFQSPKSSKLCNSMAHCATIMVQVLFKRMPAVKLRACQVHVNMHQ